MLLALQNGAIDAYSANIQTYQDMRPLFDDPAIEVTFTLSGRFWTLNLNCAKFPTNITGFRRALAYGLDKYLTSDTIGSPWHPMDTHIPFFLTDWEVESSFGGLFYDMNIAAGNASLEAAGFQDLDGDGWREYDVNGNDLWDPTVDLDDNDSRLVMELNPLLGMDLAITACACASEGLSAMGVRSTVVGMNLPSLVAKMCTKEHWVTSWREKIDFVSPPKILYNRFRTGTPENTLYHHFSNITIDTVLDNMMAATTVEEVQTLTYEASELLWYEQPQIVFTAGPTVGAYQIGTASNWTGYFEVPFVGVTHYDNSYFLTKVQQKNDSMGGVFTTGLATNLYTRNCHQQTTEYEKMVFQYLYEGLWQLDPFTKTPIPQLAYEWESEVTSANPTSGLQAGEKYTFYLYPNETWHDGVPFTSADVKFSYENVWPTNPFYPHAARSIYKIETPNDYTIELYVNQTGYFHWTDVTRIPYIVPKHIWQEVSNVTAFIPTDAQMIGTGPYKWNTYQPDQMISLLRHQNWRWDIRDVPTYLSTTTTGTTSKTTFTTLSLPTSSTRPIPGWSPLLSLLSFCCLVILFSKKKR